MHDGIHGWVVALVFIYRDHGGKEVYKKLCVWETKENIYLQNPCARHA
jgi:hypothetical protein